MRIINFGSLNIDFVYDVDHFVRAGETLASDALHTYPGGKGLNRTLMAGRCGFGRGVFRGNEVIRLKLARLEASLVGRGILVGSGESVDLTTRGEWQATRQAEIASLRDKVTLLRAAIATTKSDMLALLTKLDPNA